MTNAQKLASDPAHSVYVGASAGSGKTKVLTDRVLRILLEDVPPGKIMCLTFTNAAAAEMANRINKNLMQWAIVSDVVLENQIFELTSKKPSSDTIQLARRLFVEVLDTPDGLKIQTIHSFCQNLMKRFPLEAGIAPHFKVIDDITALELLKDSRMSILSRNNDESNNIREAINNIAWRVSEGSFSELLQEIINQREKIEFMLSKYSQDEIIDLIYKTLDVKLQQTEDSVIRDYCSNTDNLHKFCEILKNGIKTDIEKSDIIADFLKKINNIDDISAIDIIAVFDEYKLAYLTQEGKPRAKLATKKILDQYSEILEELYIEQNKIAKLEDKIKSVRIANLTKDLFYISKEFLESYKNNKYARAFLDYNDLIIKTNQLLNKSDIAPWILYKLDGGIDHLLVDEAQDTSPQQWKIIEALCEEFFSGEGANQKNRTIFIVGDEKQSIFSFQGADPRVFNDMQSVFSKRVSSAQKGWETVALDRSFRSTKPILECVDAIFSKENIKSSITFLPDYIPHIAHRSNYAGLVEIWPLVKKDEKVDMQPWQMPLERIAPVDTKKKLADQIADEIKGWFEDSKIIKSQGRAITAGDIMILVRRRNIFVDYMVAALKERNIPVAGVDRMILNDHIVIMDLIAIGEFLLLPENDLILANILKCPLINMSEDDLFKLANERDNLSLWDALKKSSDSATYKEAYEFLHKLLAKIDYVSAFAIYSYIIEALDGRRKFASRLGMEVNEPIDEFLSLCLDYEKTHPPGLQGYLHWLSVGKSEVKRDLDQGVDEVRIMTVHGSKGLQSPVVFLPDTTSVPKNSGSNIFWVEDGNDSVMLWTAGVANMNDLCTSLQEDARKVINDEYLRLLYVALTRAEDELYILGYEDSKKISDKCWYSIILDGIKDIAKNENEKLVIKSDQLEEVRYKENISQIIHENIQLPFFAIEPVPQEPLPHYPLTPSLMISADPSVQSPLFEKSALRGKLIHKLLQYLPDINVNNREKVALDFIRKYKNNFSQEQQHEIIDSTFKILNDEKLVQIFSYGSKSEVPVVGVVGNFVISGQIDRLLVKDDYILVLDYKTNRNPPKSVEHLHENYLKQMAAYKMALKEIYAGKTINCAIIWTAIPMIMYIEDHLLDKQKFENY